jgi:hypothetical protein
VEHDYEQHERMHLALLQHGERDKRQRIEQLHLRRALDPVSSKVIESFWERAEGMLEHVEAASTASRLVRQLERDVDELQRLRSHLLLSGDRAQRETELAEVFRLLAVLDGVMQRLRRRHRELADYELLRYLLWNPATPKTKPKALRDHEKDKSEKTRTKKSGRDRQRQTLSEGRREPGPKAKEGPQRERREPEATRRKE